MVSSNQLKGVDNLATTKNITMKQFNGTDYDTLYPKTIASQVDGVYNKTEILTAATAAMYGLGSDAVPDDVFVSLTNCFAQILVTTSPNTKVTASLNGKTISATSDSSGLAILKVPGFGTWTVSASVYGISASKSCTIEAISQYELVLSPGLESTSWDDISSISEKGVAASVWNVGDKKTINIDGTNYQVQIIGFNHDTKTSGGKAGITFQLVDCLNRTYQMNSSNTNSGGWTSCAMRSSTMATLLTKLPSALQNVIKAVNKLTSAGKQSGTINTTSDKLFLLSEVEIFGSTAHSKSGEGSQYAYYKAGNSKVKKVNGSASSWWERSPYGSDIAYFCIVGINGSASYDNANNSRGVAFAFCV